MTHLVKLGGEPPSLSYHAILSSNADAERTSVSPSPSTSVANTDCAVFFEMEITRSVKPGGEPPSFSYHAILSSRVDAERTSMSPSPSTSLAKTVSTPDAITEITRSVKLGGEPPSFSCNVILLARLAAEITSVSPSPSMSVAKTETAWSIVVEMTRSVKLGGEPPSLSYHAILSSFSDAERTSIFPSPSTSAAKTEYAASAVVTTIRSVKVGGKPPSFSYHAILSSSPDAERTSVSPSPSKSVAKTEKAPIALVEITRSVNCTVPPRTGIKTARLTRIPPSGLKAASRYNTAANHATVILACFTI